MSRAAALPKSFIDRLQATGFVRAEPAVLQPSEPFLDVMGEELRQRIFLTSDAAGRELCLRPDFTIPTGLLHMDGERADGAASYFYEGPVFRHGANGGEAPQAGVEIFGRDDDVAADADVVALALEACAALGQPKPAIRIGDRAIVEAAVEALNAPPAFRRRVKRTLTHGGALDALCGEDRSSDSAGLFAALSAAGPQAGRAVIEDLLQIAGITAVGGRTAGEIADRFIERASAHSVALRDEMKRALTSLIAIDDLAPAALKRLETLAASDLPGAKAAVERLGRRLAAFEAAKLPVADMRFAVRFSRGLDYYDGLTFELSSGAGGQPLAGGGRYDGLMSALGAARPVSGVGFALWLERFAGATS